MHNLAKSMCLVAGFHTSPWRVLKEKYDHFSFEPQHWVCHVDIGMGKEKVSNFWHKGPWVPSVYTQSPSRVLDSPGSSPKPTFGRRPCSEDPRTISGERIDCPLVVPTLAVQMHSYDAAERLLCFFQFVFSAT